jgi:hypothetical protein
MKTSCLRIDQIAYKNPSFHIEFKNVHLTLVKSAPKKSFGKKTESFGAFKCQFRSGLRFSWLFQNFMPHIKIMKSLVPTVHSTNQDKKIVIELSSPTANIL